MSTLFLNPQIQFKRHLLCKYFYNILEFGSRLVLTFFYRNGTEFGGKIIQVDSVKENHTYENSESVFLGNLSFKTTEDEV